MVSILGYTQMDGSSSRSFTMARAKAYTAARMGQSTAAFHERLVREHLSLADFGDTLMTSVQGGVPVRGKRRRASRRCGRIGATPG